MLRTWSVGIHAYRAANIISIHKLPEIKLDTFLGICSPKKQIVFTNNYSKKHCFSRGLPVYYSQTLGLKNTIFMH